MYEFSFLPKDIEDIINTYVEQIEISDKYNNVVKAIDDITIYRANKYNNYMAEITYISKDTLDIRLNICNMCGNYIAITPHFYHPVSDRVFCTCFYMPF